MKWLVRALVLSVLLVSISSVSDARFPRGGGGGATSAFNGGLSQVNFNFLQGGGEYPFINFVKIGQGWSPNAGVIPLTPDKADSDGYVNNSAYLAAVSGVIVGDIKIPTQAKRPGNYITKWDGGGTITNFDTIVSYSITGVTNSGTCILTIPGHNYKAGNRMPVSGVGGITGLNSNTWTVSSIAGNAVTINASVGTNCSGVYTSGGSATFSTTSLASSTGNRVIQTPSSNTAAIGVTAIVSSVDYPKNMALIHESDEAAYDAGQVFGVKFLARLREANFGVLRFFNWQADPSGGNNCSTWSNCNRPTTFYSYQSGELRTALLGNLAGSGLTSTATGTDYTISAPSTWPTPVGGKPADKATVQVVIGSDSTQANVTSPGANAVHWVAHKKTVGNSVWFTGGTSGAGNTQPNIGTFAGPIPSSVRYYVKAVSGPDDFTITTTPPPGSAGGATVTVASMSGVIGRSIATLNVGSTAPVVIADNGANPLGSDSIPISGSQGSLATLVYDNTLDLWLMQGGNGSVGALQNGVPYSVMLDLARTVGAHPWFVIPRFAQISGTDFISTLATTTKNDAAWMVPRFEGTNEDWAATLQTQYGRQMATAYGTSTGNAGWNDNINEWHGKAISLIGQAVNAVYGGTPATQTRYQVINGMQLGQFGSATRSAANDSRITSALYVSTQGGSAAHNWITHVSPSGYFYPSSEGRNQSLPLAYAYYFTNAGNAAAQLVNATSYENGDIDSTTVSTFSTPANTIVTTAPHGLFIGQIVGLTTQGGDAPIAAQNYYVQTIPTSSSLTLSSTDPNMPVAFGGCACFTPVTFVGTGTGTSYVLPHSGNNVPMVIIQNQNAKTWARTFNANLNVTQYEGGYSPDYISYDIFAKITDATVSATSTLTIPVVNMQFGGVRNPYYQPTANNSPFVGGTSPGGMDLKITGCSGLGNGWAIADNTVIHISSGVSGASVPTNLNKSGATGTLASALATAGLSACDAQIQDTNGVDSVVWIDNLRYAGKSSTTLQANLTTMYNGVGPFPSMFQMGGNTTTVTPPAGVGIPSQNVWSVLEDIHVSTNPPQWKAACGFNGPAC